MDLVTQGLLGSTVAQAACGEKLGKRTAFYGFLLGLLPDFDIISAFWGQWASLQYHRGPTHSLPILALASIPVGYLFKKITRSDAPLKCWAGMAFVTLFTHPLIDWCTTYGTPLFWPFTYQRYANDALPIIDPVYSLPLLLATFLGFFNLLTPGKRKAIAALALLFSSLYAFSGYRNSQQLVEYGREKFVEQGFAPVEVRATPTMFNNRLFRIVGKDSNNDFLVTYLKIGNGKTLNPIERVNASRHDLVDKAMNHKIGKLFTWFAMDMICPRMDELPDGTVRVTLNDMRYGFITRQNHSLFAAEALFDQKGNLISFNRSHQRGKADFKQEMKRMAEEFF